jgi:hypothetical protein
MSQIDLDGLVHLRRELLTDGYTDPQLRALVRDGTLHRIRQGAYVDGTVWRGLSERDQYRLRIRAVLRTAHPSTVATHQSAAVEHGAPTWNISLDDVHTTRADGKGGRKEAGVVHHRGGLPDEHVEIVNDIPVSVAARCAVETVTVVQLEQALVVVNGLLHAKKLSLASLHDMVGQCRHWPRSISTNVLLLLADPRIESVGESRTSYLCWAQRLPRPEPQVDIFDADGVLVGRVDFAWPDRKVFLEFDGRIKYEKFRRPGETLEEFLLREKKRQERISLLTGWTCVRITWGDLGNPVETARRIRHILDNNRRVGA